MGKMTTSELNRRQLKVTFGGFGGLLIGIILDIFLVGFLGFGDIGFPVHPSNFYEWFVLKVLDGTLLLVVCPLCLGVLGIAHAVLGRWPFHKKSQRSL